MGHPYYLAGRPYACPHDDPRCTRQGRRGRRLLANECDRGCGVQGTRGLRDRLQPRRRTLRWHPPCRGYLGVLLGPPVRCGSRALVGRSARLVFRRLQHSVGAHGFRGNGGRARRRRRSALGSEPARRAPRQKGCGGCSRLTANNLHGQQDGSITRSSADGSTLVWSTFIGEAGQGFIRSWTTHPLADALSRPRL